MIYIVCGMMLLLAAVLFLRIRYEMTHFKTYHYTISSDRLPEAFDGYVMVMLSDLHNYDFGHHNEKLKQCICELSPEAVILAGDLVNAKPGMDMEHAIDFIQWISGKYPVYYAKGNHEQRLALYPEKYDGMQEIWQQALDKTNIICLSDENTQIYKDGSTIRIYGYELPAFYYKRYKLRPMPPELMDEELGKKPSDEYTVLIAHNPLYFENYAAWGAELVLSGHMHGGIVILPFLGGMLSPQVRFFPKYYAGKYHCGRTDMVLSRGLHVHSLGVRLFNVPEVSVITLKREEQHGNHI